MVSCFYSYIIGPGRDGTAEQESGTLAPEMGKTGKYFKVGQAARLVGVSPSTLRNWETLGLFKAVRTEGRYRLYSRETINQLKRIQELRKTKHVNIPGIRFYQRRGGDTVPHVTPENFSPELPSRLKALRRSQHLTLEDVSKSIGVSSDLLADVEQGKVMPFAILPKLFEVYKTNAMSFFNIEGQHGKLVRRKDRSILRSGTVQMELLASNATLMEPHLMRIPPRTNSGGSYRHQGEELLYVLEGKIEIWLDEIERYVLEPGDSLYFKSTQYHRWCTLTDSECLILWINAPVTF
jgi:DNA-binding transcriptional MerR regulator/mannose-6-phosphate isomerase-like protein (cupin superfamily)